MSASRAACGHFHEWHHLTEPNDVRSKLGAQLTVVADIQLRTLDGIYQAFVARASGFEQTAVQMNDIS